MNISTLIMAAEYLDRMQTESEHGYALSGPVPDFTRRRKSSRSAKSSKAARSTHNELEKNRRAHLRHCFDELKQVVPLSRNSSHHTTLGLLKQACQVIKEMEECYRLKKGCLRELIQEHNNLLSRRRLLRDSDHYCRDSDHYCRGSHSVSESSSCSSFSSGSSRLSERDGSTSDDEERISVGTDFDINLSNSLRL